jgi:hypothetical protein
MAPNALKRLNPGSEMVWARTPRTYNIWYTGARLIGGRSGVTELQKKAPMVLNSLDAILKPPVVEDLFRGVACG